MDDDESSTKGMHFQTGFLSAAMMMMNPPEMNKETDSEDKVFD
jgi:hypothetical protein